MADVVAPPGSPFERLRRHTAEAEAMLEEAGNPSDFGVSALHAHIGLAQIHATLALAAAVEMVPGSFNGGTGPWVT